MQRPGRTHQLPVVMMTAALVMLVLSSCGQFAERVTKLTPEEERRLTLACDEFDGLLQELEDALDPLAEMREIVASEVLIPSQRLGPIGDPEEEYERLLVVQQHTSNAATREDYSHRRAYEALDRSIRSWILISEAFDSGEDPVGLGDEIGQSVAMLYLAADRHGDSCGPPDGVLFAAGELD